MNIKTLTLAASFLLATGSLFAQENEKIKYSNVTEFGFTTVSPRGISLEATTAHGFSIEKQHHFGLGTGMGVCFHRGGFVTSNDFYGYSSSTHGKIYMPIFFNYRFCFKPEKTFSPHVNIAVGGLATNDGAGIYSAITMGFKAGAFSFSSGLSFMPICVKEDYYGYYYDNWGNIRPETTPKIFNKWYFPFGITLKAGFTF